MARARAPARGHRGRRARARAAPHRLPRVRRATRRAGSTPALRFAGARPRPTPRASAATTTRGSPGGDDSAPPTAARRRRATGTAGRRPRRAARSARCSTACSPARRSASTRSSRCSRARGPEVARGRRGRRRAAPRDRRRRGHVRPQPQHQLHERLHVQVPVLRVLEGPAVAQPARHAVPARRSRRSQRRVVEAVECGATEVCLQGGIHPDFDGDYYLDVARAVKAVAPDIHVHGFTALEVTEGATPARRCRSPTTCAG